MKPICLRFQAFGPFAKEEVIDFNALRENKLFLISGETGSGKTTILEAITYALYGKSTGGKRGDLLAMRCQYARQEQPTEIEFTFEVQGRTYRFVRQIAFARKNYHISQNAMILEDGIFKPLFENPTQGNINREAEKIIGLTYEQFVKVIILPQGQFEQFLVADSKEKEMILVSLFKAEKWQKAANFLFDMLLSQKKELEEKRIRMDASLKEYECENIEKLKAAIMEREQKIEQLKHTIQKYDNWLLDNEESYQKYAAFVKAKEEFLQKTEQLEQDRIRLQKRVREKKECFDTLLGETDKWERVKEESIALKALEPVYKKIALLEEEKRKYGEECKKLLRQKEQAQKEKKAREEACLLSQIEERNLYKEYSDAFANYIQNIAGYLAEKLEEDKPCPVCGSTHHPMKAECHEKSVSKEQLDEIRQKMEEAKEPQTKLVGLFVVSCLVLGSVLVILAPLFPKLYNTTAEVKALATDFLRVAAACMPLWAFMHATYFTLRTGGKTIVTFLFDSVFLWFVSAPVAFILSRYSTMPILILYVCCQMLDIIKCVIGFILVKKGVWIQNIVSSERTA